MPTTSPTSPSVATTVSQPEATSGQRYFNFSQLQGLWVQAGGDPKWAPVMAAIAISESGGDNHALNDNPNTGDYSVGLWQINYYNGLAASRTARYGPASTLQQDPLANARAAVDLLDSRGAPPSPNAPGLSNWKGDRAYAVYQNGGISAVIQYGQQNGGHGGWTPYVGSGTTRSAAGNPFAGIPGVGAVFGAGESIGNTSYNAVQAVSSTSGFLKEITNPVFWLRVAEVVGGVLLIGIGVILIAKDMGMKTGSLPGPAGTLQDNSEQLADAFEQGQRQGEVSAARAAGRRSVVRTASAEETPASQRLGERNARIRRATAAISDDDIPF